MPQAAIKDIENEDNLGEARGGAPNFFGSSARLPKIDKFKISALECGGSCLKIRDSWPGGKKRLTSLYGGRIVRCTEHDDRNERPGIDVHVLARYKLPAANPKRSPRSPKSLCRTGKARQVKLLASQVWSTFATRCLCAGSICEQQEIDDAQQLKPSRSEEMREKVNQLSV